MKNGFKKYWVPVFVGLVIFLQLIVFAVFRENSYIAVHDNLDLFVSQLQIMKNTKSFFSHGVLLPMLGGISRDTFGSEFSLYNILYFLFPGLTAYLIGYFLKILFGFCSIQILAREIYGENYSKYRSLLWLIGLGYGLIPVFPAYGIAFTSVPLLIYFLIKVYKKPSFIWYLGIFLYPLVSYFSYFGFFLLAYMVCAIIIMWIKDKKFPKGLTAALFVLAAGYIVFEYRLFHEMLFTSKETIRTIMVSPDFSLAEVGRSVWNAFINPVFHAQDSHLYFVLPVCVAGLVIMNINYIRKKQFRRILTDSCNLVFLFILFNCLICGIYNLKAVRDLVELLLPPLTGFQFDRTVYFNPFLWFALLFLLLKRLYDSKKRTLLRLANAVAVVSVLVVMFVPQTYNDFVSTCRGQAYELVKGKQPQGMSYGEFYSESLFQQIKDDIHYDGEWSVAYGLHPAVLQYSGIATLDGYLGFYTTEYHDRFRKMIAPALDGNEWAEDYYDHWGARAYLF